MRHTSGHYKGLVTAPTSMYNKTPPPRVQRPAAAHAARADEGASLPAHLRTRSDADESGWSITNVLTGTHPLFAHPPLPGVERGAGDGHELSMVVCAGTDPPCAGPGSSRAGIVVRLLPSMRHGGETPEQAARVDTALRVSGCDVLYMGASMRTMEHGGADADADGAAAIVEMDWQRQVYARQGGVSAWVYPVEGCWVARGEVAGRWARREREGVTLAALAAADTEGMRVGVDWECRVFQDTRPLAADTTVVCYGKEREGRVVLLETAFRAGAARAHVWFGSDVHFFPVHEVPWVVLNHTQGAVGVVPPPLRGWHAALHALDGNRSRACLLVRDGGGGGGPASSSVIAALRAVRNDGAHLWAPPGDWVLVRGGERRAVRPGASLVGISREMAEACQRCERVLGVDAGALGYELVASFLLNEVLGPAPGIADAAATGLPTADADHQRAYDRMLTRRREYARMWG